MILQIDSRESNNKRIKEYFDSIGQDYFVSKLPCGDYANPQNMKTANGRLSNRATLAHEIIGHREANKKGWTITEDTILEEIQASIRAARFAPNLTNKERFNLLRDAGERAKKNNIKLKDIKHTLHINKR